MKTNLVKHLHFDVTDEYGNDIILGKVVDISELDLHTKIYLCEIAAINSSLHDQAQPISLEEYIKIFGRLREGNSSVPSYATPVIIKTDSLDPELAEISRQRFNFTQCTGYSPKTIPKGSQPTNSQRPQRLPPPQTIPHPYFIY